MFRFIYTIYQGGEVMAAILKEEYNDPLEYVRNLKQLGMSEEMATYHARYNQL
jgi:hypothetical protein